MTLLGCLDDVDWTSHRDVMRVLRFYELVLDSLEVDSVEFDTIAKPLERDGYVFDKEKSRLLPMSPVDRAALEKATPRERLPAINVHLRRIEEYLPKDPAAVVGSSKELIETVCKIILKNHQQTTSPPMDLDKLDLNDLFKKAREYVNLSDLGLPTDQVRRLLGNLTSIVQTIGELRNREGTGHGHTDDTRIEMRHARLVFGATTCICTFLFESDEVSRAANQPLLLVCVKCGSSIQREHNFCETCGTPIL